MKSAYRHHVANIHEEESRLKKIEGIGCREEKCEGNNRKLSSTSTTNLKNASNNPTIQKGLSENTDVKVNEDRQEDFPMNSPAPPSSSKHQEEGYTDVMGITEMDYSPARRKPPIHN